MSEGSPAIQPSEFSVQNSLLVYLAGPMTGLPEKNFPAFHAAAAAIRAKGHRCISPAELNTQDVPWDEAMRRDLLELLKCQAVVVLPGWKYSKGARIELYIAVSLGLPIYEAGNFLRIDPEQILKSISIQMLLEIPALLRRAA